MRYLIFMLWMVVALSPAKTIFAQLKTANAVGQQTFFFEDASRNRKLTTEVWYPTSDSFVAEEIRENPFYRLATKRDATLQPGKFPVILFSHGTGGGRLTVEWLCAGLASHGYIVVAVDHFGNTFDNPIPEEFVKIWNRPQDISYVLTQVLKSDAFSRSIDADRIGAAGFSLGGFTSVALAGGKMDLDGLIRYLQTPEGKSEIDIPEMPGLISMFDKPEIKESFKKAPSLTDPRIKCVFVMAPAVGNAFPDKASISKVNIPVYIVGAQEDKIAPVKNNAQRYSQLISQSKITIIPDAGHYVFLNEAKDGLKQQAPVFFSDSPVVNRKDIHEKTLLIAVKHFDACFKK